MKTLVRMIVASGIAFAGTQAGAVTSVTYKSNVVALQNTNFSTSLDVQKFDTSLGTLRSVLVSLTGSLLGTVRVENMDAQAAAISTTLGAKLIMARPDGSTIVITIPTQAQTFNLAGFDGSLDFGGASGALVTGIAASSSESVTLTDAADMALFTGGGLISAPLQALANSSATGGGNLLAGFQTQAGGYAEVTYFYDAVTSAVPEPATWAMLVAGFGLVGVARRRRIESVSN